MTLSKEELSGLIERVRGLKGADREVDVLIWLATTEGATRKATTVSSALGLWDPYVIDETRDASGRLIDAPHYTGSVDAIRALTDRLLDGNNGRPLLYGRTSEWAAMALPEHQYTETLNFAVGEAPALKMLTVSERAETECAAALLSLLLSLQSQEPTP